MKQLITIIALIALPSVLLAQVQQGGIRGTVSISYKIPLPNVTIEVMQKGLEEHVGIDTTSSEGKYDIRPLAPGLYHVKFKSKGFAEHIVKKVMVHPDISTEIDVRLQLQTDRLKQVVTDYHPRHTHDEDHKTKTAGDIEHMHHHHTHHPPEKKHKHITTPFWHLLWPFSFKK